MLPHHPATWIRHGDLTDGANSYRMLTAAPTLATDGIPVPPDLRDELATLDIVATAAGAYSFDVEVYGYKPAVGIYLTGAGLTAVAGAAGWTNVGTISVTGTLAGREAHQLQGIAGFSSIALRATNVVGAPSIWGDLGFSPHTQEEM